MRYSIIFIVALLAAVSCKSKVSNSQTGASYKDVDVAGAKALISENKDLVILDVRTPEETAGGMIENAIAIDYHGDDFMDKISILNKDKSYLVYCKSGGRSSDTANKMIKAGFKDVTNLEGGYTAWSAK